MPRLYFSLLLIFFASSASHGQDTPGRYLQAHRYPIDLSDDRPDQLDALFKRKLPRY